MKRQRQRDEERERKKNKRNNIPGLFAVNDNFITDEDS